MRLPILFVAKHAIDNRFVFERRNLRDEIESVSCVPSVEVETSLVGWNQPAIECNVLFADLGFSEIFLHYRDPFANMIARRFGFKFAPQVAAGEIFPLFVDFDCGGKRERLAAYDA